jgi:hypothetical protein
MIERMSEDDDLLLDTPFVQRIRQQGLEQGMEQGMAWNRATSKTPATTRLTQLWGTFAPPKRWCNR